MSITQGLHRAVQQTPEKTAVIYGQRSRTFLELRDRVARLAGGLRDLGVQRGDRVAILSANSDRYHEYFYGVPWAGAVFNPVNTRWSSAEVAYSLGDSGTRVLITDERFATLLPEIRRNYTGLKHVILAGEGEVEVAEGWLEYEELLSRSEPIEDTRLGEIELAGVFYTGGTTGFPRGVMLTHSNLMVSALGAMTTAAMHTPQGRALHAAPMFHIADFALWIAASIAGNTHVIVPQFDARAVASAIAEHQVTDTLLVPTMIQMLVEEPLVTQLDMSGLRHIIYGGSSIPISVLISAMKTFPSARFVQAYGMTELAPVASLLLPEEHVPEGPGAHRLSSCGRAAPHTEIRIFDSEGREVPRGKPGEIGVRGANMMVGYLNKPDETAAAIIDGWMHTGDIGWMDDDGYVYVVDRLKDMIISGGENVYSTEVENAIASHPAVAAVAVIGLPDERWGERVHAVISLIAGETLTLEEIQDHTRTQIAGYKTPRSVAFVDSLPISGAGKILKRQLRDRYADSTRDRMQPG